MWSRSEPDRSSSAGRSAARRAQQSATAATTRRSPQPRARGHRPVPRAPRRGVRRGRSRTPSGSRSCSSRRASRARAPRAGARRDAHPRALPAAAGRRAPSWSAYATTTSANGVAITCAWRSPRRKLNEGELVRRSVDHAGGRPPVVVADSARVAEQLRAACEVAEHRRERRRGRGRRAPGSAQGRPHPVARTRTASRRLRTRS